MWKRPKTPLLRSDISPSICPKTKGKWTILHKEWNQNPFLRFKCRDQTTFCSYWNMSPVLSLYLFPPSLPPIEMSFHKINFVLLLLQLQPQKLLCTSLRPPCPSTNLIVFVIGVFKMHRLPTLNMHKNLITNHLEIFPWWWVPSWVLWTPRYCRVFLIGLLFFVVLKVIEKWDLSRFPFDARAQDLFIVVSLRKLPFKVMNGTTNKPFFFHRTNDLTNIFSQNIKWTSWKREVIFFLKEKSGGQRTKRNKKIFSY